jgi:ArsR family metal-binding transcriptional regulator
MALTLDEMRKADQKNVDEMKAQVEEIKEVIRLAMNKGDMTEVVTKSGTVRLVPKDVYQPDKEAGGWDKIWAYIFKNKDHDLLEKRLHQGACKQRYEDGKKIPGVKIFPMVHVKLGDAE